jgi:putative RecB family exonuclease
MSTVMDGPVRAPARLRPPNQVAQNLTGRPYLSYTQISLMRSCPRKFAFQYVENAGKDFLPVSLIFGGAIHSALEHYFRAKLEGETASATALVAAFSDAWQRVEKEAVDALVRFNKGDDQHTVMALARRMIDAFLASPLAEPKGIIYGIEEQITVELDPDLPDILAKVDLVTEVGRFLHVIDFKTSRSKWNEQKAQENAEQLLIYGTTMQSMSQGLGRPTKLHFAIITKAKKPIVQLLPVAADPDRVAGVTGSIRQIWQAMQAGNFYPSPSPQNCSTCPYRSRCTAFSTSKSHIPF